MDGGRPRRSGVTCYTVGSPTGATVDKPPGYESIPPFWPQHAPALSGSLLIQDRPVVILDQEDYQAMILALLPPSDPHGPR